MRGKGVRATGQGLRRVFQAISREPCFSEDVAFDIDGDGLRVSFWRLGRVAVIQVIRPEADQSHMRPPRVVPTFKFGTQGREMVKPLDERHASEPLVLQSLDNAFGDSDGSVLAYGAETRFDVPLVQEFGKGIANEDRGLV